MSNFLFPRVLYGVLPLLLSCGVRTGKSVTYPTALLIFFFFKETLLSYYSSFIFTHVPPSFNKGRGLGGWILHPL